MCLDERDCENGEMGVVGCETGDDGVEYLDLFLRLRQTQGKRRIETSIFRKTAAADLYLHATSAHPEATKSGMIKGERIRFLLHRVRDINKFGVPIKMISLTLCSDEQAFDEAWRRFAAPLATRGYLPAQPGLPSR